MTEDELTKLAKHIKQYLKGLFNYEWEVYSKVYTNYYVGVGSMNWHISIVCRYLNINNSTAGTFYNNNEIPDHWHRYIFEQVTGKYTDTFYNYMKIDMEDLCLLYKKSDDVLLRTLCNNKIKECTKKPNPFKGMFDD